MRAHTDEYPQLTKLWQRDGAETDARGLAFAPRQRSGPHAGTASPAFNQPSAPALLQFTSGLAVPKKSFIL